MSVHFEERSGVIPCKTPWGSWYQTMDEVFIEVNVPYGTSGKEVKCNLGSKQIELQVKGKEMIKGKLFGTTVSDEGTWTLEDKNLIRIVLMKTNREAGNCWASLLEGEYSADSWVQDQMQKKLTLERFQREVSWAECFLEGHVDGFQNPGFDFSGAEISGNYGGGGPEFSSQQM